MADIVDSQTRSRMMSGIKSKNTRPEIITRRLLHSMGFHFRLNVGKLPGKPDIVLPRYKAVVFINGCFWHGHDCSLFKLPATRTDFWKDKIAKNCKNDVHVREALISSCWRIATVWECALRGSQIPPATVMEQLGAWIRGTSPELELKR